MPLFGKKHIKDPRYFADKPIAAWPKDAELKCGDIVLWVYKSRPRYAASQDLLMSLRSSGYRKFLYQNRDLFHRPLRPPRGYRRLEKNKGEYALATVAVTSSLDPAETVRIGEGAFSCLEAEYRFPEVLETVRGAFLGQKRLQGYIAALAAAVCDPEQLLLAFMPGGIVAETFAVFDRVYAAMFLALRTGRDPDAVMDCLSAFNIPGTREGVEVFVKCAYARMKEDNWSLQA